MSLFNADKNKWESFYDVCSILRILGADQVILSFSYGNVESVAPIDFLLTQKKDDAESMVEVLDSYILEKVNTFLSKLVRYYNVEKIYGHFEFIISDVSVEYSYRFKENHAENYGGGRIYHTKSEPVLQDLSVDDAINNSTLEVTRVDREIRSILREKGYAKVCMLDRLEEKARQELEKNFYLEKLKVPNYASEYFLVTYK